MRTSRELSSVQSRVGCSHKMTNRLRGCWSSLSKYDNLIHVTMTNTTNQSRRASYWLILELLGFRFFMSDISLPIYILIPTTGTLQGSSECESEHEEESAHSSKLWCICIGIALVLVFGVCGVGIWWFFIRSQHQEARTKAEESSILPEEWPEKRLRSKTAASDRSKILNECFSEMTVWCKQQIGADSYAAVLEDIKFNIEEHCEKAEKCEGGDVDPSHIVQDVFKAKFVQSIDWSQLQSLSFSTENQRRHICDAKRYSKRAITEDLELELGQCINELRIQDHHDEENKAAANRNEDDDDGEAGEDKNNPDELTKLKQKVSGFLEQIFEPNSANNSRNGHKQGITSSSSSDDVQLHDEDIEISEHAARIMTGYLEKCMVQNGIVTSDQATSSANDGASSSSSSSPSTSTNDDNSRTDSFDNRKNHILLDDEDKFYANVDKPRTLRSRGCNSCGSMCARSLFILSFLFMILVSLNCCCFVFDALSLNLFGMRESGCEWRLDKLLFCCGQCPTLMAGSLTSASLCAWFSTSTTSSHLCYYAWCKNREGASKEEIKRKSAKRGEMCRRTAVNRCVYGVLFFAMWWTYLTYCSDDPHMLSKALGVNLDPLEQARYQFHDLWDLANRSSPPDASASEEVKKHWKQLEDAAIEAGIYLQRVHNVNDSSFELKQWLLGQDSAGGSEMKIDKRILDFMQKAVDARMLRAQNTVIHFCQDPETSIYCVPKADTSAFTSISDLQSKGCPRAITKKLQDCVTDAAYGFFGQYGEAGLDPETKVWIGGWKHFMTDATTNIEQEHRKQWSDGMRQAWSSIMASVPGAL